jgi:hypothetical protein
MTAIKRNQAQFFQQSTPNNTHLARQHQWLNSIELGYALKVVSPFA